MSKISEQRREDILKAAGIEFKANGVDRASISDIAARAGIGKSTVYEYFPSKADLLAAFCSRKLQELDALCRSIFAQDLPLRRLLIQFVEAIVSEMEHIDLPSVLTLLYNYPEIDILTRHAEDLWEHISTQLKQTLLRAQAQGELAAGLNLDAAACWLLSLPQPQLYLLLKSRDVDDPVELIVDYALNGLVPRP